MKGTSSSIRDWIIENEAVIQVVFQAITLIIYVSDLVMKWILS